MKLLRVAVSVGLILALLWWIEETEGIASIGAVLARADWRLVALAFAASTADRAVMVFKWRLLLRNRGLDIGFWHGMRIYCTSMLWGTFLPSTVGADALRVGLAMRAGLPGEATIASIIVERVIGFLCSLIAALAGLLVISLATDLGGEWASLWWIGGAMLAGGIGAAVLSLNRAMFEWILSFLPERIRDSGPLLRLRSFHDSYVGYYSDRSLLGGFGLLTFAEIAVTVLMNWVCALALGVDVSLLFFAGAFQLALLVARLPISIDGFGVFEGVLAALLLLVGVHEAEAISIALLTRIVQTVSWLPWWFGHVVGTRELQPSADLTAQPSVAESPGTGRAQR